MIPLSRLLPVLLLLAPLWACGDPAGAGTGTGPDDHRPARITAAAGNEQSGLTGQTLAAPVVAVVADAQGRPVAAAAVAFRVIAGGGSVAPALTTTDAQGQAQAAWTLGSGVVGIQLLETQALDASGRTVSSDTFFAIATVPRVPTIEPVNGSESPGGYMGEPLYDSIGVVLRDADGSPQPGIKVAWTVLTGGGTVSPDTSVTNANGVARANWIPGYRYGEQKLRAQAGPDRIRDLRAIVQTSGFVSITAVSGDGQTASALHTLDPLVVEVRNGGHTVENLDVTWTTHQDGTVTPALSATGPDGRSSALWTLGTLQARQTATAHIIGFSAEFSATALFPLRLAAQSPRAGATVGGDTLQVAASLAADRQLAAATAMVDGRMAALVYRSGTLAGALDMSGVAAGTKTLRIVAHDVAGDSAVATVAFNWAAHAPTLLSLASPIPLMTANPDLPIQVTCGDCASLEVRAGTGALVASGTTAIRTSVSLAPYADPNGDALEVPVTITGTSAAGESVRRSMSVYAFDNPAVERVAFGGARLLDVSGQRALYATAPDAQGSIHLVIRALPAGAETDIATLPPSAETGAAFLTPAGAIWTSVLADGARVQEYRGGAPLSLGPADKLAGSLQVEGTRAAWSYGPSLVVRDLQGGTSTTMAADVYWSGFPSFGIFSLAPNGDVVYVDASQQLVRVREGTATRLTGDPGFTAGLPKTDGTNVVYTRYGWCATCQATMRIGPGGPEVLESFGYPLRLVSNGWVAFMRQTPGENSPQLWTRSPAGVLEQRGSFANSPELESLGPDGQVTITSAGRRYLSRPGAAPVRLVTSIGRRYTTSFWRGSTGYVVVENTALRIVP
jgi:hypothetical protein